MNKIDDYNPQVGARILIEQHTIGGLRNNADLDNCKYHSQQTLDFAIDFLSNIDASNEDKISFLLKMKEEIPKFYGTEKK